MDPEGGLVMEATGDDPETPASRFTSIGARPRFGGPLLTRTDERLSGANRLSTALWRTGGCQNLADGAVVNP